MARHCTDVLWLVVFAAAVAGFGLCIAYAKNNGNFDRVLHGYNYEGELCGVEGRGRYLYWCQETSSTSVNLTRPICTDECPDTVNEPLGCPVDSVASYAATGFAGRYCLPTSEDLQEQVINEIGNSPFYVWALRLADLSQAWSALLASGVFALSLGFLFLGLLDTCAAPLIYMCIAVLVAVPSIVGAYLLYHVSVEGSGLDGLENSGDAAYAYLGGSVLVGLGFLFLLCACCNGRSVAVAIGCVKAAAECIFDSPLLLLSPVIELYMKLSAVVAFAYGFLVLLSTGEAEGSGSGGGIYRKFAFSEVQYALLAYYVFFTLWTLELITSLSQFAVAYAVQLWYFTPFAEGSKKDAPNCRLFLGYTTGLTYHLGTLCFGSLLIATLRLARMVLAVIARVSKDSENPAADCMAQACGCCISCFQRAVEGVTKNAYIDVAIHDDSFCTAAYNAVATISSEVKAVTVLNGATWIMQFAGGGAITAAGAGLTWIMCLEVEAFSNPASEQYVSDPVFVTGASALICALVALAFMLVFDTVSDTILYCFAVETMESKTKTVVKAGNPEVPPAGDSGGEPFFFTFLNCGRPSRRKPADAPPPKICAPSGLRQLLAEHRA